MKNLTGAKECRKIVSMLLMVGVLTFTDSKNVETVNNEITVEESIDNVSNIDGYIYIPLVSMNHNSSPKPVGYTQELINTSDIYTHNNLNYQIDRIITFYVDSNNVDIKNLRNNFTGHLMAGEIMSLYSQEEGKVVFAIYKPIVRNNIK